jgi:LuxR family transcriptional regulator, maltose regulon positive regulatory protein
MATTFSDSLITVPLLPPRHVSRPRLLADLDRAADLPFTLLCAGPGAGKTVLLTEWAQNAKAQVAWITPGAADVAPRRFWNLLESALPDLDGKDRADPGTVPGAGPDAVPDAVPGAVLDPVQLLLSQVPDPATPLVVIIDDAHLLTHPDILDGLDRLARGRHQGLRLILAARSDPLLPLHKYRLAGQMAELRAAELAMTPAEIREVLAVHGVSLPKREVDVLVARTEGWAAGVRLSAMRMEGTERPADFVSQLALDAGSIGEYLVDEVLQRLPDDHRRLLVETSFLDEVTGPLAGAVTGMTGCEDMLASLTRDNSFVIPLDPMRTRYRYHQLFGEILRYLLQRREGQAVCQLKTRAAAWFEREGDLGSAMFWAVQADDGPRVASLLARGGLAHAVVHRQDLSGLRLRELIPPHPAEPAADLAGAAESAVAAFAVEATVAAPEAAAAELDRLRAWQSGQPLTDRDLLVTCDVVELLLGQKACDDRAVDGAAARLLGAQGDVKPAVAPGLHAAVLLTQASVHLWHGRHEDVGALLEEAMAEAESDGQDGLKLEALSMMACLDSLWSRAIRADRAIQRAQAMRKAKGLGAPPALELATAVSALFSGNLSGHARAVQRIVLSGAAGADPALETAAGLVLAAGLLARDQRAEPRAILQEQADRVLPPALGAYRDIMLADLETSYGRPRSALARLERSRKTKFAPVAAPAAARAHLALSDLRSARDCVRDVLASPSSQISRFTFVEALLCDARIAAAGGDEGQALEILVHAFDAARGEVVLPFHCASASFADLLARHPGMAGQWPAGAVAEARVTPVPVPAQRVARELPDPLTPRELTILRLLATTLSTGEIADELCLSVNTVKTHLAAIYRKLPASRRREAVLRARDLELI